MKVVYAPHLAGTDDTFSNIYRTVKYFISPEAMPATATAGVAVVTTIFSPDINGLV